MTETTTPTGSELFEIQALVSAARWMSRPVLIRTAGVLDQRTDIHICVQYTKGQYVMTMVWPHAISSFGEDPCVRAIDGSSPC